jgi:hypothetical protein
MGKVEVPKVQGSKVPKVQSSKSSKVRCYSNEGFV